MLWCLISCAVCSSALAMAALWLRPSRLRLPQINLRGCIATIWLLVALGFAALALRLAPWTL